MEMIRAEVRGVVKDKEEFMWVSVADQMEKEIRMLNETQSDYHCRESGSECGLFCAVAWGDDRVVSKLSKLSCFDEKLCFFVLIVLPKKYNYKETNINGNLLLEVFSFAFEGNWVFNHCIK